MTTASSDTALFAEPAPRVDPGLAARLLREHWDLEATVTELGGERDRNFLAVTADGSRLVLKVTHSAEDPEALAMEDAALEHVVRTDPGLTVPRVLATPSGATAVPVTAPDGREHRVRLVTAVPGASADSVERPRTLAAGTGAVCARLAVALRGFVHPASRRRLEWDPRRVCGLRPHLGAVRDAAVRERLAALLDRFAGLPESLEALPSSVLHGDLTPGNVMVGADGAVTGVIDFGDMHHTARVSDLAIALASVLRDAPDPWREAGEFLDAYQRITPLEPAEVEVLGELVLARLATALLISAWRVPLHPDNTAYLTGTDDGSRRLVELLGGLGRAELAARMHRLCGTSRVASSQVPDGTLQERRDASLGGALAPLFYRRPLQVVRGEGVWLYSADGRRHLDAYNNVPVLGHAHPAVVQAISRQQAVLNVNSRYLHPNAVELAERLAATLPDGLDTCVFVNSGSEANDLAWRMAAVWTGRTGAVVTDHAYHGVSAVTAPMSTNAYPPSARPADVGVFVPPAPGTAAGAPEAAAAVASAREQLRAGGHDLSLLAVDTVFSSVGVLEPSADYMRSLAQETRAAGGLFLADEVQAGFGRGGRNLWRFLDFGLTPDFVTLGKPMGNGHPVAALITRREIADRFTGVDEYFSTFGGNPVSCAAALTVLDVVEQRDLVAHSGRIGELLRAAVREETGLAVRGQGLFAGMDVVPGEDGGPTAADVAERLREAGVLVGTTGRDGSVLKVRPPLVWEEEHVRLFVDALRGCLGR
jgi:4-aminobutyrate aminotransferase-like enzyme/Ser/Thr protein kinase RdoA (MazF antagonist)